MSTLVLDLYLPIPGVQRIITDYLMPDKERMIFRKYNLNRQLYVHFNWLTGPHKRPGFFLKPSHLRMQGSDHHSDNNSSSISFGLDFYGFQFARRNQDCAYADTLYRFYGHYKQSCFYCCERHFNKTFYEFERIRQVVGKL